MANARDIKQRIKSVKNIAQVTRALQAVSASRVRKAMEAVEATRPYSTKSWQVLTHVAGQPGRNSLHPLLTKRSEVKNAIVVLLSGDRGLAGPYNTNIMRFEREKFSDFEAKLAYVPVGRKGAELLYRRGANVLAQFADMPAEPTFNDVSAIGQLIVDDFLEEKTDEVYLVYTDFVNMIKQIPTVKKLLPLEFDSAEGLVQESFGAQSSGPAAAYTYEPGQVEILDEIVPRFTSLQIYQAILESFASEHAARMVAMKNATDNASDLSGALTLEYNKVRQQSITNEMLDIAGGAEALAQAAASN